MRLQQTSLEAYESIQPELPSLQDRVWRVISKEGGLTCEEVEQMLRLSHQTASARIRDLVCLGRIINSGEQRKTASGRKAIVWRCA